MSSSELTVRLCWSLVLGVFACLALTGSGYYFELARVAPATPPPSPPPLPIAVACESVICELLATIAVCSENGAPCIDRALAPVCVVGECSGDACVVVDAELPLTFDCACLCA